MKARSGASYYTGTLEVTGFVIHGGKFDVVFIGALEVGTYGNANSTIVEVNGKQRRFTESGRNDIVSLAKKTVIMARREKRKIKERLYYVTSPGYVSGKDGGEHYYL